MNSWTAQLLRVTGRLLWLKWELLLAFLDYVRMCASCSMPSSHLARADWLQRSSKRLLKVLKIEILVGGRVPRDGLLVCNHLSYLDIVVLGSLAPSVFVAKSDIKSWPVFGWYARMAGTIFINREKRSQALHSAKEIEVALRQRALVILFPEGTSSGGDTVLPFKSSLLEAATREPHGLTAGHIRYELREGNVSEEVCYWKDMTLVPHLINLLRKPSIRAAVAFSEVHQAGSNRKELARQLHSEVLRLKALDPHDVDLCRAFRRISRLVKVGGPNRI